MHRGIEKSRLKITRPSTGHSAQSYRNILIQGEKELPAIPDKPTGKRGKIAKADVHNLWERLNNHEASVLLFARDPNVPFTNNRAEMDFRMAKVKQ